MQGKLFDLLLLDYEKRDYHYHLVIHSFCSGMDRIT